MEKTGATLRFHNERSIIYVFLPMFLQLQYYFSLVEAVDIIFYQNGNDCTGNGLVCSNVPENFCCFVDPSYGAGGVEIVTGPNICVTSTIYGGGQCTNVLNGGSQGDACYLTGWDATGATVSGSCRRRSRSLLSDRHSKPAACVGKMEPNGVIFNEHGTNGSWMLTSSNAIELFSQLQTMDDTKKAHWFKSQGATYRAV